MVVYTVNEAFNDGPSETDPGSLTVSADVVPGNEGRKHVDTRKSRYTHKSRYTTDAHG